MPDPHTDPLEALLVPATPLNPDPLFAATLRERLGQAVAASNRKELLVSTNISTRPRNGLRHGDVSYITLGLPDAIRGRVFYGSVLGWHFSPGRDEHGAQVDVVVPMIGLWDGDEPAGRVHGAVLGFRVDDIAAAVAAVRAHGGTITDPHREPYALAAEGRDDQGIPFYLHQMPGPAEFERRGEFHNGDVEGDVSYLTMVVPDLDAARVFYGGVFGWTFNIGQAGGAQVDGVAPQIGMASELKAGPSTAGVILCYRVDDIEAAAQRVEDAGGQAGAVVVRPYGRESYCVDDQGTPFYLHQF
jgi:uncharacterized protein